MPEIDIDCPIIGEAVLITLDGYETRGKPAFRGFSCELEAQCHAARISCALFDAQGPEPFDVAQALKHLGAAD